MGIYQFLAKRGLSPDDADISHWPQVGLDRNGNDPTLEARYRRLNLGLEQYCADEGGFETVSALVGVQKGTLSRAVGRCFQKDDCGNFIGRVGLIKGLHLNGYRRVDDSETNHAGIFKQLLERTGIRTELRQVILGEHPVFAPCTRLIDIHKNFMTLLEQAGAPVSRYPYTVKNRGKDALRTFVRSVRSIKPLRAVLLEYGPAAARKIGRAMYNNEEMRQYLEPYERVEIDAHKLDGIIILEVEGPDGVPVTLVLERLWIIVAIEVKSTSVLGWSLGYGRNPTRDNVAEAMTHSIVPQGRLNLSIPNLVYSAKGGYPATDVKDGAFRLPDILEFDNDKAHWSNALHDDFCFKGGAILHLGPGESPDDRPNIENLFDTLEEEVLHRFKITTGSHPADPRRQHPEAAAIRYRFNLNILRQVLDVWFCDRNGRPPSGTVRNAPLVHLEKALAQSDILARRVPPDERLDWSLHEEWQRCFVRGGGTRKHPPYVNVEGAKYSSERLRQRWDLLNKEVRVRLNRSDSLRVKMYLMDGTYFDELLVEKRYRVPHSFFVRELYNQIKKQNEHEPRGNLVQVVFEHLRERAKTSKKHANQLQRLLAEEPSLAASTAGRATKGVSRLPRNSKPALPTDPKIAAIAVPRCAF